MNRLSTETSLYLRQHAQNPVDWFPWSDEALERAKAENKPIFLSVGYSACHWCHVMEHECFENDTIAAIMNEHFINIKVDREERPDLDTIYMTAHHVLNRGEGGGWPLSVFLAPDLKPFYAGTYFPPDNRYAPSRPSFPALLKGIAQAWENKRDQLHEIGNNVVGYLQDLTETASTDQTIPKSIFDGLLSRFQRNYDPVHGGFGSQPKFPHSVDLRLLLRLHHRSQSGVALDMVRRSLEKMARGGLYDQVGGGFHRYSVDAYWLVPHFEKMLYDNALLPVAYTEAYQVTGDEFYQHMASETLDYVLREMTSEPGGFYSTQDADSEGEEGKFFVWSIAEVERILGAELGEFAARTFSITEAGNFEGHSILFRARPDADDAKMHGLSLEEFRAKLSQVKCKLYGERAKRIWPGRDEKILTAWNGLMIAAFAQAGAVFGQVKYLEAAQKAAAFIRQHLRNPDGRLLRTCGIGQPAKLNGYLEDYAYLADGLITLWQATGDGTYLEEATGYAEVMLKHFADHESGGFYFTADDHENLIARTKDLHDNATPAANAVAVSVLSRLGHLLDRPEFTVHAEKTFSACRILMSDSPMAAAQLLIALDHHLADREEIVLVGIEPSVATKRLRPHATVIVQNPAKPALPRLAAMVAVNGEPTMYRCRGFMCQAPVVGRAAIEANLAEAL
ncbi:MAG: thioredoxin domain-containing protein [Fimbriiglobus sp.]